MPSVAILGASADPEKFGNKSIHAHAKRGFDVFPVNPKGGTIDGFTVYRSLADVPVESLDRISVYLPPHVGLQVLDEIVATGCREVWFNPGSDSPDLIEAAQKKGLDPIRACSIIDVSQ